MTEVTKYDTAVFVVGLCGIPGIIRSIKKYLRKPKDDRQFSGFTVLHSNIYSKGCLGIVRTREVEIRSMEHNSLR